jgi:hypothetical protein
VGAFIHRLAIGIDDAIIQGDNSILGDLHEEISNGLKFTEGTGGGFSTRFTFV